MSRHLYWRGIFHFHGGVARSCKLFESSEISCLPKTGIRCIATDVCNKFYVFASDLHSDDLEFRHIAERLAAFSFLLGTIVYRVVPVGFLLCCVLLSKLRVLYLGFFWWKIARERMSRKRGWRAGTMVVPVKSS